MASLPLLVIKIISVIPEFIASFTTCSIIGLSYIGKSYFGMALVAGSILVPSPATGMIALVNFRVLFFIY